MNRPATLAVRNGSDRNAQLAWACVGVALVAAPFVGVYPIFVMTSLCFAIFAIAFNLLLGFTGLLSFGHAAFFGGAAYVTGWLMREKGVTPLACISQPVT